METIKRVHGKAHMELTLLLIDGENTDVEELEEMFRWISEIDPDIPLHLSRYYPANRMTNPPTQIQTLMRTQTIAEKYLNYVYIGNPAKRIKHIRDLTCPYNLIDKPYEVEEEE